MAAIYSKTGEHRMAIQKLSTQELLTLSQKDNIKPELSRKIGYFFNKYLDFKNWKRNTDFYYYLGKLSLPRQIDYQNNIVYFDNDDEKITLLETLAWIILILQNENSDEESQKIAFELSCIVPNFWQITNQENIHFSYSCEKLSTNYLNSIDFNIQAAEHSSINERENLAFLEKILTDKNWQEIANNYWSLDNIYNNMFIDWHTSYGYLLQHHFDVVLYMINNTNSVWKILWLIAHLENRQITDVILKTDNKLAIFLLLHRLNTSSNNVNKNDLLSLSKLWENLEDELLKKWLSIFNKFSNKHKTLQYGIGKFLCESNPENIQIYINSLDLNSNYQDIGDCIQYFLSNSTNESREYFCELSFEKWKDWQPENGHKIFKSVLDEVIVYYFQYYCDEIIRGEFINKHLNEIFNAQNRWFDNKIEFNHFVEFHLSKIQPACIADESIKDTNLTLEDFRNKKFTPNFFQDDKRWQHWL